MEITEVEINIINIIIKHYIIERIFQSESFLTSK